MQHSLKVLPCFYQPIEDGRKRFEIRYNKDRGFQAGDTVEFREYEPDNRNVMEELKYTGRRFYGTISYVLDYEQKDGWVVFGFTDRTAHTTQQVEEK